MHSQTTSNVDDRAKRALLLACLGDGVVALAFAFPNFLQRKRYWWVATVILIVAVTICVIAFIRGINSRNAGKRYLAILAIILTLPVVVGATLLLLSLAFYAAIWHG